MEKHFDVVVVGGGINGTGVARDAAGRGLRVCLVEQADLAQYTSSASTKLIHGGLRYLETFDFSLVRHALIEREVLLASAPHIIWPMRFVLPHHAALRPRWMIRLGLFLYDHLGGRKRLRASNTIRLRSHPSGAPLKPEYTNAFEYADCWVQDARLVVLNARHAQDLGAVVLTRTRCVSIGRTPDGWRIEITRDGDRERPEFLSARALVNASGPWVKRTLDLAKSADSEHGVRLVKGSHIVVPRLFEHDYAYIFQNPDKRVVFAIPFESRFTLIGTTDVELEADPGDVRISDEEVTYLCDSVNEYFQTPIGARDVVWSYSGVRPLYDDAAENASLITRDYVLQVDDDGPPVVSIFGGKITTYRRLAEDVLGLLQPRLEFEQGDWTRDSPLPGGDIPDAEFDTFVQRCESDYAWLPKTLVHDYARNYGTDIDTVLKGIDTREGLGAELSPGLFACEVEFLMRYEWAETAEDVLWRRTKKGLLADPQTQTRLCDWMTRRTVGRASS